MKTESEVFVPDNHAEPYQRTTHLCISAHQDDVEIMAQSAIVECFGMEDKWFGAVVTADGAGSPRTGLYEKFTDEQMKEIRIKEQKKAAYVGEYSFLSLLKYKSSEIKGDTPQIIADYAQIIKKANPEIIYTHNIADKHPTHVGVALKVIKAIRSLPKEQRPEKLYGVEVWRDLDWLNDENKVKLDCGKHLNLERAMLGVFDSQIEGGKRYDLATEGRRIANATYAESHGVDNSIRLTYAMDLTPLIKDDLLCIKEFITAHIEDFKNSVLKNINSLS
jgi:LmbE family N-acetylglucosaminyl deacetylase